MVSSGRIRFCKTHEVTQNLNGQNLKVNDKTQESDRDCRGNLDSWKVQDTAKQSLKWMTILPHQYSEWAAVWTSANSCPYGNWETTKRLLPCIGTTERVHELLLAELNERLGHAGIHIIEARISHLACSLKSLAMLQRQQSNSCRRGTSTDRRRSSGMVEMAWTKLSEKEIVQLDEERKANAGEQSAGSVVWRQEMCHLSSMPGTIY